MQSPLAVHASCRPSMQPVPDARAKPAEHRIAVSRSSSQVLIDGQVNGKNHGYDKMLVKSVREKRRGASKGVRRETIEEGDARDGKGKGSKQDATKHCAPNTQATRGMKLQRVARCECPTTCLTGCTTLLSRCGLCQDTPRVSSDVVDSKLVSESPVTFCRASSRSPYSLKINHLQHHPNRLFPADRYIVESNTALHIDATARLPTS